MGSSWNHSAVWVACLWAHLPIYISATTRQLCYKNGGLKALFGNLHHRDVAWFLEI
jgi:hypothetical protein